MWEQLKQALGQQPDSGDATTRRLVKLLRKHLPSDGYATVVVLTPAVTGSVEALRDAFPGWSVISAAEDAGTLPERLAARHPIDVIIDADRAEDRRKRFRRLFYHLTPGGLYVVPGGAGELGPDPGELGTYLAEAATRPRSATLRSPGRRSIAENSLRALRQHVQARGVKDDLVLSHDLPDVRVKLDEPRTNAYLGKSERHGRVLAVRPAGKAPQLRDYTEGPVRRDPPVDGRIGKSKLSLREYRDAIVGIEQVVMTDAAIVADSYRHHQRRYLTSRSLVDVAPGFGIPRRRVPAELPRLRGSYLHLDNEIRGHFGHLMTETLSRVWSWHAALEVDPDVKVLLGATRKRPVVAEWEYGFYEACGIPRDRIVLIDGYVRVERLLSGTPMFSIPQYVHPGIVDTWNEVGDRLAAQAAPREWPRRFFVARRTNRRSCTNAADVERLFAERGFTALYPEDYSLYDQVALFRQAEAIGGWCGSGTFHLALVRDPKHLIRIGPVSYQPRNELLIAAVRGHRIDDVTCSDVEDDSDRPRFSFNLEREGPYLTSVLERVGAER